MEDIDETHGRTRRRRTSLLFYAAAVFLWTMGGALSWAGLLKPMGFAVSALALPVSVTTWPAHEALLELSGVGFGANALISLTLTSFVIFFAWSALLWTPVLILCWKRFPATAGVALQASLLLVTFAFFWRFGNG